MAWLMVSSQMIGEGGQANDHCWGGLQMRLLSDSFLFGADTVYKNMFEEAKYVEVYRSDDIQRELGLSR